MSGSAVLEKPAPMPTKLQRISVALDDEAYAKLKELSLDSKRSVANMAAVLIENALYPGGRVLKAKEDNRGGKREGAGRPPKATPSADGAEQQEERSKSSEGNDADQ
jgi:CopG-like RHH_1 or ribbon-helix-helix domain, RHH_5